MLSAIITLSFAKIQKKYAITAKKYVILHKNNNLVHL